MKVRAIAFSVILIVALLAYWAPEHAKPNAGLPLVKVAWNKPTTEDSRLFAQCPWTPWSRPTHSGVHTV